MDLTKEELLNGVIASVEAGITTPEDAVKELKELGIETKYTVEDFRTMRNLELHAASYNYDDYVHDYAYGDEEMI
jgi:hypothetical protein